MGNLDIYNMVRNVPKEAQKEIKGGRLNGKTDINPMWRIKALTEQFGPCGVGWKSVIKKSWLEPGGNDEIAAFVEIDLYIRHNGEWSEAIPGTGGSSFVAKEKSGLYVSDECFKMAYTDALSVACKLLGVGADIYWAADKTKYDRPQGQNWQMSAPEKAQMVKLAGDKKVDMKVKGKEWTGKDSSSLWTEADYKKVMEELRK